eukprot:TRINITY_DN14869_c0_g2_i1.p1 TRINITY_DN14869_c0_g2~~TRINITY_DN14869_c0_g2_i1.p1  ORF type:complete len:721 (-),score=124.88 TRINITY_DN14869_c0_g2_i1:117-2279(-)
MSEEGNGKTAQEEEASPVSEQETIVTAPSFSGVGLNSLADQADASHRLLNLVPAPFCECIGKTAGNWRPGYSLSPAAQVWASRVKTASPQRFARAVGVVGATSAGKSWLIGKLQEEGGARPSQLEECFDGVTLQSMTSDINLYSDPDNKLYYIDFEGTYGTQPLQKAPGESVVMKRVADARAWEAKRRQALKEFYQPAVAYLTCNVVIFVTREKLVCTRAMEECQQFAEAANARVMSAVPPALILVQNCCRPTEGFFNSAQCTQAFLSTHFDNDSSHWQKYFRSIDCFCIPDEYMTCKRTKFDGEEVCAEVIAEMRATIATRIEEDVIYRAQRHAIISQLQWFAILSALCRIINDQDTVQMSSLYMNANASDDGTGGLQAVLLQLMSGNDGDPEVAKAKLRSALGLIARYAVRRQLSTEDVTQVIKYLLYLMPCGAVTTDNVERFDGKTHVPVVCGQMRILHGRVHRSAACVRTLDGTWLQDLSEWCRGGVVHTWPGEFECESCLADYDSVEATSAAISEEIEAYRLERCLEGLNPAVGFPWISRAHSSLSQSRIPIRRDNSRLCVICTTKGQSPGFFDKLWHTPPDDSLPACDCCYSMLRKHKLCGPEGDAAVASSSRCEACFRRSDGYSMRTKSRPKLPADQRLFPCGCIICINCTEELLSMQHPRQCPLCHLLVRWFVDERDLLKTGWPAAVRHQRILGASSPSSKQGMACISRECQ